MQDVYKDLSGHLTQLSSVGQFYSPAENQLEIESDTTGIGITDVRATFFVKVEPETCDQFPGDFPVVQSLITNPTVLPPEVKPLQEG